MKKLLALLTIIAAGVSIAWATTVRPASVEKLTRMASAVVEGQAVNAWTAWNPEHTVISTYTSFQVSRTLKGQRRSTVLVKQAGGSKDGLHQVLFGVRHFQVGESAVLFLQPPTVIDGTMEIVDLMQGNFRILRNASGETTVSNGVPDVQEISAAGKMKAFTGAHMTLQQLESRVLAVSQ